jgi:5'-methylthioadenosine phosphorylase
VSRQAGFFVSNSHFFVINKTGIPIFWAAFALYSLQKYTMVKVGLMGGSGLEKLNILENKSEVTVSTPYGSPSSSFYTGKLEHCELVICSRHGRDHSIPPSQVNYRANVSALKELGCRYVFATSACGSLREEIGIGDLVIPDQFIDFTRRRIPTFHDHFEEGKLGHVSMADPFSEHLRNLLIEGAKHLGFSFHPKGTVITIEGPRFSTRAESEMFRILGADVINMTLATEAALAYEAGLPYAAVALSTDYDSWKIHESPVTWDEVLKIFRENVKRVTDLLLYVIRELKE